MDIVEWVHQEPVDYMNNMARGEMPAHAELRKKMPCGNVFEDKGYGKHGQNLQC